MAQRPKYVSWKIVPEHLLIVPLRRPKKSLPVPLRVGTPRSTRSIFKPPSSRTPTGSRGSRMSVRPSNRATLRSMLYMDQTFIKGSKRSLVQEDLGKPNPRDDPNRLFTIFQKYYSKQDHLDPKHRSLFGPICKATGLWQWYVGVGLH